MRSRGFNRRAVLAHDELVGGGDAVQRAVVGDPQNQRIVQAAGTLHHRAAAGTAAKNRNSLRFTRRDVDLRRNFVGITDDDKMFARFPEAQDFPAVAGFASIQQRLVAGEIFGGRGEALNQVFILLHLCVRVR